MICGTYPTGHRSATRRTRESIALFGHTDMHSAVQNTPLRSPVGIFPLALGTIPFALRFPPVTMPGVPLTMGLTPEFLGLRTQFLGVRTQSALSCNTRARH